MLTQSEADDLINISKMKESDESYGFPLPYLLPYNGLTIDCPHLHLYVKGFMDKWAIPAPNDEFSDTTNLYTTLQDFFHYCTIVEPPKIHREVPLYEF